MASNVHVKTALAVYSSFALLGVYRGIRSYNYDFEIYRQMHMQNNKTYLYTGAAIRGAMYGILYTCPILNLFIISKEIYRLEVNLRGMQEEMENREYYELL
jgi:hypothetical protein